MFSSTMRIGVYDCIYVALAEQEKCELVTADATLSPCSAPSHSSGHSPPSPDPFRLRLHGRRQRNSCNALEIRAGLVEAAEPGEELLCGSAKKRSPLATARRLAHCRGRCSVSPFASRAIDRLLRGCFNLLQDVHHQVFPESPPAVCGTPAGMTQDSPRRVWQQANGCEIIAQPMSHGLHLFGAAGSDANGVRQDAIQVDAAGKPLLQRLGLLGRAASDLPHGVGRRLTHELMVARHDERPKSFLTTGRRGRPSTPSDFT